MLLSFNLIYKCDNIKNFFLKLRITTNKIDLYNGDKILLHKSTINDVLSKRRQKIKKVFRL